MAADLEPAPAAEVEPDGDLEEGEIEDAEIEDGATEDSETEDSESDAEPAGPVIHVPGRELEEGAENGDTPPAKKRTRRGSRGGRGRKKKTAAATGAALATEAPAPVEEAVEPAPEPGANGHEGDWGYTPMSEWGMDDS